MGPKVQHSKSPTTRDWSVRSVSRDRGAVATWLEASDACGHGPAGPSGVRGRRPCSFPSLFAPVVHPLPVLSGHNQPVPPLSAARGGRAGGQGRRARARRGGDGTGRAAPGHGDAAGRNGATAEFRRALCTRVVPFVTRFRFADGFIFAHGRRARQQAAADGTRRNNPRPLPSAP